MGERAKGRGRILGRLGLLIFICLCLARAPYAQHGWTSSESQDTRRVYPWVEHQEDQESLADRFPSPEGWQRVHVPQGSFAEWLRHLPMKPAGSAVLAYNGHVVLTAESRILAGVVHLDLSPRDLQQCADAILRLRAEYLWSIGRTDQIAFHFTSGDLSRWSEWASGTRPRVRASFVRWEQAATPDSSRASFRRYLDNLFMYAGTISLKRDATPVRPAELSNGDFFLGSGSPGHAVIILDMIVNAEGDNKVLIAQSFMPAQELHVLNAGPGNPWFDVDLDSEGMDTPSWSPFPWSSLRRFVHE